MQPWQYFLERDREHDLTDLKNVQAWAVEHEAKVKAAMERAGRLDAMVFSPPRCGVTVKTFYWLAKYALTATPKEQEEWSRCVMALRLLARRFKNFTNGRKASMTDREADRVIELHVSNLMPVIVCAPGDPFIKNPNHIQYVSVNREGGMFVKTFAECLSVFWQGFFGSLVFGSFPGMCGECGNFMGVTRKTGKPKRGDYCRNCVEKFRWRNAPLAKRRKADREKKRRQRAKKKAEEQQPEGKQ